MAKGVSYDLTELHNALMNFLGETWTDDYNGDYCIQIVVDGKTFAISLLDVHTAVVDGDDSAVNITLMTDNSDDPADKPLLDWPEAGRDRWPDGFDRP